MTLAEGTITPPTKLEPLTVRVKGEAPAEIVLGLRDEIEGSGMAFTVNVAAAEVAPPGFWTVTLTEPALAI